MTTEDPCIRLVRGWSRHHPEWDYFAMFKSPDGQQPEHYVRRISEEEADQLAARYELRIYEAPSLDQ